MKEIDSIQWVDMEGDLIDIRLSKNVQNILPNRKTPKLFENMLSETMRRMESKHIHIKGDKSKTHRFRNITLSSVIKLYTNVIKSGKSWKKLQYPKNNKSLNPLTCNNKTGFISMRRWKRRKNWNWWRKTTFNKAVGFGSCHVSHHIICIFYAYSCFTKDKIKPRAFSFLLKSKRD